MAIVRSQRVTSAVAGALFLCAGGGHAEETERPANLVTPSTDGAVYTPDNIPPCDSWYPIEALKADVQGATTLETLIGPDGRVREARVEKSAGHPRLDEQAAACVLRKGRSAPPDVDGKPGWKWQRTKVVWKIPPDPPAVQAHETAAAGVHPADGNASLSDFEKSAKSGNVRMQELLGQLYREGRAAPVDLQKSLYWFTQAAERGSSLAQYNVGLARLQDVPGPHDYGNAAMWFRKAAHQHHAEAAYQLALLYQSGLGVELDPAMAFNWVNAAIEYAHTDQNPRYEALQRKISLGLSTEEARAATLAVSPDGPVGGAKMRDGGAYARSVKYPVGMQYLEREGFARLIVLVDAEGTTKDVVIETSSGYPQLDAAVVKALQHAPFIPREVNGRPVAAWQAVTWYFVLR